MSPNRYGRFGEQTNLLSIPGFEPRFVQPRSVDSFAAPWTCLLHSDVQQVRRMPTAVLTRPLDSCREAVQTQSG